MRLEKTFQEQSRDIHKTLRDCWGRKRMKASRQINDGVSTLAMILSALSARGQYLNLNAPIRPRAELTAQAFTDNSSSAQSPSSPHTASGSSPDVVSPLLVLRLP
ncbi:hypothetical protein EVAR_11087_1 [Eumeta japonica]|uniref:Uncharacterized protein n=1 Tax=Eumeta variegata TaxID=151549 RepID=A0A4C1U5D6_EUMVA|nr:hypothetical protein EVAR_11087_1 [Eumeta japonica]